MSFGHDTPLSNAEASGDFIGRAEDSILAGPIGTGGYIASASGEWKPPPAAAGSLRSRPPLYAQWRIEPIIRTKLEYNIQIVSGANVYFKVPRSRSSFPEGLLVEVASTVGHTRRLR